MMGRGIPGNEATPVSREVMVLRFLVTLRRVMLRGSSTTEEEDDMLRLLGVEI